MIAGADQQVSPERCQEFAHKARAAGNKLEKIVYAEAGHNFDDPGKTKQAKAAKRRGVSRRSSRQIY
jgi:carboxymethylenebutenolidase